MARDKDRSAESAHRGMELPVASAPITLRDVAAAAGVSQQTVSYVVNNKGSISQAVRARVQEVVDRLGYVPNKSAQAMRTGRSRTLGLVIADLGHPYWAEYAQAVKREATKVGYAVLLIDADDTSPETIARIDSLRMHTVDGIITTLYSPAVARLQLPIVLISGTGTVPGRDSVISHDASGGALVADHLLGLGHRKFGLVTSPIMARVPTRRQGFIDRLPADAQVIWEHTTLPNERPGPDIVPLLKARQVTAIVCSNDVVAIGLLRTLHDLGLRVPQQVSVTGYDDLTWAEITIPGLTTVRQPYEEAAAKAVGLLIDRIEQPQRRASHIKLSVSLVERESTAPPDRGVR